MTSSLSEYCHEHWESHYSSYKEPPKVKKHLCLPATNTCTRPLVQQPVLAQQSVPSRHLSPPQQPGQWPAPTQQPGPAKHPAPMQQQGPAKHPVPTQQPGPAKHLAPTEQPSPAKHLAPTEQPSPAKHPAPTQQPGPAQWPAPTQQPRLAKHPAPTQQPPHPKQPPLKRTKCKHYSSSFQRSSSSETVIIEDESIIDITRPKQAPPPLQEAMAKVTTRAETAALV